MKKIILASRGSRLSRTQTDLAAAALSEKGIECSRLIVKTRGDIDRTGDLSKIGGDGLFVREIERVVLSKDADAAVHSAKDLPYSLMDNMMIGATLPAADSSDCLVMRRDCKDIKIIGTGSARRAFSIKRLFPLCTVKNIRGNVETRLGKLLSGEYDAIVLAAAGMERLGIDLSDFYVRKFSPDEMVPSCGQGIIAIECRADDYEIIKILKTIDSENARKRLTSERCLFRMIGADCSVAAGAHAEIDGDDLTLYGMFEGKTVCLHGKFSDYEDICADAAGRLRLNS